MLVRKIGLQNFRNITSAFVELAPGTNFFMGLNGQGKTNFLESLSMLTALRSFRAHETIALIQHEHSQAALFFEIDHEVLGIIEIELKLYKENKLKYVSMNGLKISKLSDFIGLFPTVTLCDNDRLLLQGAPSERRRFLDVTLSTMDPHYLNSLQAYHQALQQRNCLLKQSQLSNAVLAPFEHLLAEHGHVLFQKRSLGLESLCPNFTMAYSIITNNLKEVPELIYRPNIKIENPDTYIHYLAENRNRDHLLKSTQIGPHRDDFIIKIKGRLADTFASEGQQRGLVLSLKYAQLLCFQNTLGIMPLLLADDVLGPLDSNRSEAILEHYCKCRSNCRNRNRLT